VFEGGCQGPECSVYPGYQAIPVTHLPLSPDVENPTNIVKGAASFRHLVYPGYQTNSWEFIARYALLNIVGYRACGYRLFIGLILVYVDFCLLLIFFSF